MRERLQDVQLEVPYIEARWKLSGDSSNQYVVDDVGGLVLGKSGVSTLGLPSIVQGDDDTCAMGGCFGGQISGFRALIAEFSLTNGVAIEAAVAADPYDSTSYLFSAPGQAEVLVAGSDIQFSVWTTSQHTLSTVTRPISGPPQLVICTYDPVAELQTIFVDGEQVAQSVLTGSVATITTDVTRILEAVAASNCVAVAQDIALYGGPISPYLIARHYNAFAQVQSDPHVITHSSISISS